MRYTKIFFFAAVAAAALSCNRELESPEAIGGTEISEISASLVESDSKTVVDSNIVFWEPDDEIKLFYDGTGSRFSNLNSSLAKTAKFSGSMNVVFVSSEGFSDDTPLWGLYPYRADAVADNESITTTLPSGQIGRTGSFGKGMNMSIARSKSLSMGYYNVCGGVRFSVTHEGVTDVVFESLGGEAIAGRVKLAFKDGVPAVVANLDSATVTSITLTAPEAGTFEVGEWYYIVALPGTLSSGFKMTFNTEKQTAVLESSSAVTFKRGIFGSLAEADAGLIYKDKPGPTGEFIKFRDPIAKYACLEKFDKNPEDGEVSYTEAAAATDISGLFKEYNTVSHFDELKYFTGITNLSGALKGLAFLKSVTIPAGFTALEANAFDGCSALDSLTFAGDKIESIGNCAFRNCSSLKEISLPKNVNSVGSNCFQNCTSLSSVEIPSGVETISRYCFLNCTSLETVGFPSGLEAINEYAFSGCKALESVELPSALNTVGSYAFQNCTALKSIAIPNSVTVMSDGVFKSCQSIESAKLPSGLTSVPAGTFSGCTALCHVTFPDAVTEIGNQAFYYCSFFDKSAKVSKIELPSTVTTIGSNVFGEARNVLITTSSSFVSIQSNTFSVKNRIYVPDAKVEMYKIRTNWSLFAGQIYPLSSYTDEPAVFEAVDLGLSVKWANCNIGAGYHEDYGRYFSWGDVEGQTWSGSSWSGGGFSTYPAYELDAKGNLKPEYDAAHINLGGSWRMPTKAEQQELINNCTSTWTSINGVNGRLFTSKKEGYTDKSIFLPAAGYGYLSLCNAGSYGYYWSSTFDRGDDAWDLNFSSGSVGTYDNTRYYGRSVRPVSE